MAHEFATQQQLDARRVREGRGTYLEPAKKVSTFKAVAMAWLETSPGQAPQTRAGYASIVDGNLIPGFGSTRVDRISASDIRRFAAKQRKLGRSANTVRNYLRVLNPILESAIEDEHIHGNPMAKIKLRKPMPS